MRNRLILALCYAAVLLATDMGKWWTQFQTAVARGDAKTVAHGAHFPMNWENGSTREIKAEADLVNKFEFYFTPEIRKVVASHKPEVLPSGTYIVTWKARGNEYSLYFKPDLAAGFVLDGLSEGPS